MPYYEIRAFDQAEAETVAHWAQTKDDVWKLTGADEPLLTAAKVFAWSWETNFCFTLRCQGDLVAYAEIIEDEVENDVEIQHLLVAPDQRGKGNGKTMLLRLCAFLEEAKPYREVWFRAGRDNIAAAHCALSAGFEEDTTMSGPRYIWLKKTLNPHKSGDL